MTISHKKAGFLFAAILFAIGCAAAGEVIAYRIYRSEYHFKSQIFTDGSEAYGLHNCDLDNNILTVTGSDPHFKVSTDDQTFSRVRIVFREPVPQDTSFKLYYAPVDDGISEKNSVERDIKAGTKQELIYFPRAAYETLRFDFDEDVSLEGIYIGEREWLLLPYRVNPIRMIMIFCMVFIPLCWLILRKRKEHESPEDLRRTHGSILLILLCNLFLSLTVVFFQPLECILVNSRIFQVRFGSLWWVQLFIGIGIALILSLIMYILPKKAGRIAAVISLGLGIAFLVQILLFNEDRILPMNTNWPMEMLNIHTWIGIVILVAAMGIYAYAYQEREKKTETILCIIAYVLIAVQIFNFTILATVADQDIPAEAGQSRQVHVLPEAEKKILSLSMERGMPFLLKDHFIFDKASTNISSFQE